MGIEILQCIPQDGILWRSNNDPIIDTRQVTLITKNSEPFAFSGYFENIADMLFKVSPDGQSKAKRKERLSLYVYLHRKLSQSRSTWPCIAVYYMFYDSDNPHITKNLPYRLIYTKADVDKI